MAYYSTHGISQFLLNNEKQRVRLLLARRIVVQTVLTATFNSYMGMAKF